MLEQIFPCVFPNIDANVRARRYRGFTEAMKQMKWQPKNTIEAAVFLAHVSHETDGLKTLVEYCAKQSSKYHHVVSIVRHSLFD